MNNFSDSITEPRIQQEILDFIAKNAGTTEFKIAKEMSDKHICARVTTHKVLHLILLPNKEVIDKKIGNSFHRFYINDKNEFIVLKDKLEELIKLVKGLSDPDILPAVDSKEHKELKKTEIPSCLQSILFLEMIMTYNRMSVVKSQTEREILLRLFGDVLLWSSYLSAHFMNLLYYVEQLEGLKKARGTSAYQKKVIDNVIDRIKKYWFKTKDTRQNY